MGYILGAILGVVLSLVSIKIQDVLTKSKYKTLRQERDERTERMNKRNENKK